MKNYNNFFQSPQKQFNGMKVELVYEYRLKTA